MRYILSLIIFLSFNLFAQSPLLTLMSDETTIESPFVWTWNFVNCDTAETFYSVVKVSGGSAFNGDAYSSEGFVDSVYFSFSPRQNNIDIMMSLNSDPATDASYEGLDYAWYMQGDGNNNIYESGSGKGVGSVSGTYVAGDVFLITYDGTNIKYYKNGDLARTVVRAVGDALYLDSSFLAAGYIDNIAFRGQ